jgi:hypothetical protein
MSKFFRKVIQISASAKVTVICLLLMVVMVIWGTLFEAAHGLLAAREMFFQSWIFWTNHIPFPGIKLLSFVLIWNLGFSFFRVLSHPLKNSGVILIHAGVAFLLCGAFFSAKFSKEFFLPLHEGEGSGAAYSYESSEIAVYKRSNLSLDAYIDDSVPIRNLKDKQVIRLAKTGVAFTADSVREHKNTEKGIDRKTVMYEVTLLLENACQSQSVNRVNLKSGNLPLMAFCNQDTFYFSIRPVSVQLPVQVQLLDFSKELHPGTETLKDVRSRVSVKGGTTARDVIISMNKPFRFGAYTFYQASYSEDGGSEVSNFSVVYNPMRFFPYAASLTIVGGFLLHLIIMVFRKLKEKRAGN